ncbi:hypothetical protein PEDI_25350 [Persicobacter diffluens]|uniref:Uncharacterized protein n=1 Tax=Persicobacter diffluens TaxID=981 RepID=A0AAN4VZU5_9BACT|nr:hypothetical protein PEDI_25350 [Persicobacter diffluens]
MNAALLFSFFLDKKRNKKIKAVINSGESWMLLPEPLKALFVPYQE